MHLPFGTGAQVGHSAPATGTDLVSRRIAVDAADPMRRVVAGGNEAAVRNGRGAEHRQSVPPVRTASRTVP